MAEEKPGEQKEPTAEEKMDAWSKRMDAMCDRMDAWMEENGKKKDAKKKDAKKDDDGEDEPMADDKRKDAKEEGEEEKKEDDRKDAKAEGEEEGEEEKKPDAKRKDAKKDMEEGGDPEPMAADDKRKDRKDAKADDDDKRMDDDDKRMDARADNAKLRRRIDELERQQRQLSRERTDEEIDQLAEAQRDWGVVAQMHGERASRPLDGEPVDVYNRRHAKRYQKHSTKWGKVDLSTLPRQVLDIAVPEIRADSKAAAQTVTAGDAVLREIQTTDRTGRIISEFVGPVSATLAPFRLPVMRVKRINNQPSHF
jgi:hypothetical protein